jgi:DNA-binding MarR family transcriptional regulator
MNDLMPITDTPNTTAQLSELLSTFMTEIFRCDTTDMLRLLKREDLSMPRIAALNVVERQGAASITEICAYLDLSLGNTSILIDKLVCHGFVTRIEDASDRRHKLVRLTEKGQALIQELRTARVNSVVQRMLLLPPELLDRVVDVLHDVTDQLPPSGGERTAGASIS